MEIRGKLENEDILNYNLHHYKNSPNMQKRIKMLSTIGPVMFLGGAFIASTTTDIPIWYWLIVFGIASVLWFKFYPKRVEANIKKNVQKLLEEGDNAVILEESTIKIDDKGISKINSKKESSVTWESINRIDIDEPYIYIYESSANAYIIRDDMFKSKEERQDFINLINSYFKGN